MSIITAKSLKRRRENCNLSQVELGALVGRTNVMISHYEGGRKIPLAAQNALDRVLTAVEKERREKGETGNVQQRKRPGRPRRRGKF